MEKFNQKNKKPNPLWGNFFQFNERCVNFHQNNWDFYTLVIFEGKIFFVEIK
jgi:hypothetical protein